ncbi:GH3 auxin-responsive promoter family protein [Blattabacterium cuenoti]|uniref:GH3 auxin-responsive promoter family protein n=1 Tax=Blattabacterium cuenoti TaxID=1653831 RepID=UPI00163C928F|nr:GH3 auxin-responsive promoter family protein [Blattabacterium cuenoti]
MIKYISEFVTCYFLKKRIKNIKIFMHNPVDVQNNLMNQLIMSAKNTEFGKKYGFNDIKKYKNFVERIPICKYSDLESTINRIRKGEKNILWPGTVKWFARSSGTTNTKSKYIPITEESINKGHYKAGKDMLSIYINNHPKTKIFLGKAIRLGGSYKLHEKYNTFYGDLSSILIKKMPFWIEKICIPGKKISLMSQWEEKINKIIKEAKNKDIRILSGVCSWLLIFLFKVLKTFDKKNIDEIWPNVEVIFHGGMNIDPYYPQYKKLLNNRSINYYNVYSSSEGFFAIQDRSKIKDLLLLLDHGIFYEFIPIEDINKSNPKIFSISEVKLNKIYAMVISTNSGLWRYIVGDTIRFTSLSPYRILISGRTTSYINCFGEELIMENTDKALNYACIKTNSMVNEYTAGPIYMNDKNSGAHEWIIEFKKHPENLSRFIKILDKELQKLNSDYESKRYKNIILRPPIVKIARNGLFYDWLKKNKKLGGQNKVPRLSNDRKYINSIMKMNKLS